MYIMVHRCTSLGCAIWQTCQLKQIHVCPQVLADTAFRLVANGFKVTAHTELRNSRRYVAVYSLITAYLDNPGYEQLCLASAKKVSVVLTCV